MQIASLQLHKIFSPKFFDADIFREAEGLSHFEQWPHCLHWRQTDRCHTPGKVNRLDPTNQTGHLQRYGSLRVPGNQTILSSF